MDLPEKCELPAINAGSDEVGRLLKTSRTIVVVGLSPNPNRPSHRVALYLKSAGYKVIPVRPGCAEILGEKCYPSLDEVPGPVDVVDVFRKSEYVPPVAEAAVRKGAKALWLQEGVVHNEAAKRAASAGLVVVQDRCILKEHKARLG